MNSKLNKKHTCLTAAALAVSLGLMGNSAMAAGEGLVKVKEKPQTLKQALGKRLTVDRLVTTDQERYIIKFKDEMTSETVEVSALKGKGQISSAKVKGKKPFDIASAKSEEIGRAHV